MSIKDALPLLTLFSRVHLHPSDTTLSSHHCFISTLSSTLPLTNQAALQNQINPFQTSHIPYHTAISQRPRTDFSPSHPALFFLVLLIEPFPSSHKNTSCYNLHTCSPLQPILILPFSYSCYIFSFLKTCLRHSSLSLVSLLLVL